MHLFSLQALQGNATVINGKVYLEGGIVVMRSLYIAMTQDKADGLPYNLFLSNILAWVRLMASSYQLEVRRSVITRKQMRHTHMTIGHKSGGKRFHLCQQLGVYLVWQVFSQHL